MSKNDVDDLLAGGDEAPAKKTKPAAKKAAAEKPAAKKAAPAKEAKPAAKKAAPAKEAKPAAKKAEPKSENGEIASAILKLKGTGKKAMPYVEVAEKTGFNIRSIRRVARALRDEGKIELVKEGTTVSVKVVAAAAI